MNKLYRIFLAFIFIICSFLISFKFYQQKVLYTPKLFNQDINGLVFGTSFYPGNIYKYLNDPKVDPAILGYFSNQINQILSNYSYFSNNSSQVTFLIYKNGDVFTKRIIFKGKFKQSEVAKLTNLYTNPLKTKAPRILKTTYQNQINHLPNSNYAYFYFEPNYLFTENENPILGSLKLNKESIYLNTYTKLEIKDLKNFKSLDHNFNCDAYKSKMCIVGNSLYKRLEILSPNFKEQLSNSFKYLDQKGIESLSKAFDGTYNFELSNNNNWVLSLDSLNFDEADDLLRQMLANFRHDISEVTLDDGSKVKRLDQAVKSAERRSTNKLIYELKSLNAKVELQKNNEGVLVSFTNNKSQASKFNKTPLNFTLEFFSFADEIVLIKLNQFFNLNSNQELNLAVISNLFDDGLQTLIKLSWD